MLQAKTNSIKKASTKSPVSYAESEKNWIRHNYFHDKCKNIYLKFAHILKFHACFRMFKVFIVDCTNSETKAQARSSLVDCLN